VNDALAVSCKFAGEDEMKKTGAVLELAASLLWLCASAVASSEYVVVNNNNSVANSATIYRLNSRTGRLTKISVLHTGGQGLGVELDFSGVEQAVSRNMRCLFVLDTKSSDIAAFSKATKYKRVGRYFDSNLISGVEGDSIALSPDDKFLYASYTDTGNVGAWGVNADCALEFVTTSPGLSGAGPLEVTPNGNYLLARGLGGVAEFSIDRHTGSLTYIATTTFRTGPCARESACTPYGIEITKDSKLAIFASYAPDVRREHMIPLALTALIARQGLMNPAVRNLTVENDLRLNIFPFLSAAGYEGNGPIYLGVTSGGQYSPGVLTADFTEKPAKFAVTNSTLAKPEVGNIAVTGNLTVIAQYPNQISVFRIQKDGSLKLLSTTTIDEHGEGMFSLSIFPNTR
jgi:hypothetical protein